MSHPTVAEAVYVGMQNNLSCLQFKHYLNLNQFSIPAKAQEAAVWKLAPSAAI